MEVTKIGKHSSLLYYVNNTNRKQFYSTGPGIELFVDPKLSRYSFLRKLFLNWLSVEKINAYVIHLCPIIFLNYKIHF